MATLPQPPQVPDHRSLQININSEDDARAVVQHLSKIRAAYETLKDSVGIDSVEFCIAETIRKKVDGFLIGAVGWTRTYCKSVSTFNGNVHFPLPHYTIPVSARTVKPEVPQPKVNRYLKNNTSAKTKEPQTLVSAT
jgi:hypothetical protein